MAASLSSPPSYSVKCRARRPCVAGFHMASVAGAPARPPALAPPRSASHLTAPLCDSPTTRSMLAEADQERFDRLRFVEIKHGRIAMLAVLGQIVTKAGIRLPGDIDFQGTHFSDIGTGWSALGQVRDPPFLASHHRWPPPPPRAGRG